VTVSGPEGRPLGMTASSLASVSLQPPLVSICIDHQAELHDTIRAAEIFVVNILESAQEALSRRFADPHDDRFEGIGHRATPDGLVFLDGALAHIECRRDQVRFIPDRGHLDVEVRIVGEQRASRRRP